MLYEHQRPKKLTFKDLKVGENFICGDGDLYLKIKVAITSNAVNLCRNELSQFYDNADVAIVNVKIVDVQNDT